MAAGNQTLHDAPVAPPRASIARPWSGAGGRWLVWVLRVIAWSILLLIGYRGVVAIMTGTGTSAAPGQGSATAAFPRARAEAYAQAFGQVYLSFSPAQASARAAALSAFLPAGAAPQLGWNGSGTEVLQSEQVAGIKVLSRNSAVVSLLARVNGTMITLAVPIYSAKGGMVVSGEPALLAPPGQIALPGQHVVALDPAVAAALSLQLPGFFRAYASGDRAALERFLARGATVSGLGGAVRFSKISQISVPDVGGAVRNATVRVIWEMPAEGGSAASGAPARIEVSYAMTVVLHGGTWYVRSIGPAAGLAGPP